MAAALAVGAGCQKPATGPKRPDHAAAHTPRYHPEVRRPLPGGGAQATQPADADETLFTVGALDADPSRFGRPVMFVNGQPISVADVLEPIIENLTEMAATENVVAYRNRALREVRMQIDYQISSLLIYEQAKPGFQDEKIKEALKKEADRMIRDVVERRYGGAYARYEAHLRRLGLTIENMKEKAQRHAVVMKFLQDRFKPLIRDPTRRELLDYYQNHPEQFTTTPRAELFLIEAPLEAELGKPLQAASPAEISAARESARRRLEQARQELAGGTDFAEVARKYCKGVRARVGGAWGEITPGALTGRWKKAEEVLFTLGPGQTSGIVEGEEALFIVRCGQAAPARKIPFQEAQPQIIARLTEEDFNRRQNAYIQELRSKAVVEGYPEFVQAVLASVPKPGSRP